MATISKTKQQASATPKAEAPLIVEPHPADYVGFPFITLLQFRKHPMLAIIDNSNAIAIKAYVLDLCGSERVDEEMVVRVAAEWYETGRHDHPLSVEFSRRGMTPLTSRIYRVLNLEFVARAIGPVPNYPMQTTKPIKRRRRKPIASSVEVGSR